MIEKFHYENKLRELKNLRNIPISESLRDAIYERIKNNNPEDFENSIEDLLWDQERFSIQRIVHFIVKYRDIRQRKEEEIENKREREFAEKFFNSELGDEECKRQKCKGCPSLDGCRIRSKEWLKSIRTVYDSKRGEAKEKAEQAISYMQKDYLGGI